MFVELFDKIFSTLNKCAKRDKKNISPAHGKNLKNVTSPLEFKTKNIVLPDNKTEREIEALYTEIRELQAKNREKIHHKRFFYS